MIKQFKKLALVLVLVFFGAAVYAQSTISGTITDAKTGEGLIGVNILVKGTVLGTVTDVNGNFNLKVSSAPPFTLVISSIGYERIEQEITSGNVTDLEIQMEEAAMLGQEVVVSASRVEESILESPVSIEKMDILDVQSTSADTYYKAIANLKGVDVATSSINFQIINARGFGSTGNTRFVQLIDGMDTQAPALNFPIGNLNGPSELDVESVELIPGASSALYGPAAFNGVLLINSKNPFDYQGLSAFAKLGVNHVGENADHPTTPMYEASLRYAKAFNNKFAFKVNFSYSRAEDWHGTSRVDRNEALTPEGLNFNPGTDALHLHGDEATANMGLLGFAAANGLNSGLEAVFRANTLPTGGSLLGYALDLPAHVISAPSYEEADLIDYGAENIKANVGLYYRLTDNLELSYLWNAGFGTSIYTGAQRYSLSNFGIQQHRVQLRGDNFFLRAYGTFENSGDSYITEFLALKVNERATELGAINFQSIPQADRYVTFVPPPGQDVSNYLASYSLAYAQFLATGQGINGEQILSPLAPGEIRSLPTAQRIAYESAAHQQARAFVDGIYRFEPGTETFEQLKSDALEGVIPDGPFFADQSAMYHAEGQYDFKNQIDWLDLQVGASFRLFDLGSNGTIFPDTVGNEITIAEYGIYAQASKEVTDDLKFSGSLRFDKNENFDGQINPRIAAVYTVADNHNLRAAYQTGFRFPTTQGQYIDLDVLSARLLGGLPEYYEAYGLPRISNGVPFSFRGGSVQAFRNALFSGQSLDQATSLLVPFTEANPVVPEQVQSIEFGYKSLIDNRLLVDAVYYFNMYDNFITQEVVVVADADQNGDVNPLSIISGSGSNTFQIYTNLDSRVRTQGAAISMDYSFDGGYTLGGNYNWNQFIDGYDDNVLNDFNTPEHKFNINFGNRKLTDRLGFNVTYRWQDAFRWESTFAIGDVPAYNTVDAQVSIRLPDIKSVVKIGGSNILNEYYIQSLGGPNIGAIYYISVTFDEMMK